MQNLLGLQKYIPKEEEKLGQLKLTMAKFYRVNGGSTQNIGVTPDLKLPSTFNETTVGESSYPSALAWDKIAASDFNPSYSIDQEMLQALKAKYNQRLDTDVDLQNLMADTKRMRDNQSRTSISLNEAKRIAEREEQDKRRQAKSDLEIEITTPESGGLNQRLKLKDVYLQESLFVLADMIAFKDA